MPPDDSLAVKAVLRALVPAIIIQVFRKKESVDLSAVKGVQSKEIVGGNLDTEVGSSFLLTYIC